MKRRFLLTTLAAVLAALLPIAACAQVESQPESSAPPPPAPALRYEVFAGYSYTSINQVNQSRHGLQGVEVSGARYFGKYFGLVAIGDYYKWATASGNPGDPSVASILVGPQLRVQLAGPVAGFFRGTMGGEHSGGEHQTPKVSFAGGIGGGIDIGLAQHFLLRISGDRIGASFSPRDNSSLLNYSPHLTWNSRGTIGVVYRF